MKFTKGDKMKTTKLSNLLFGFIAIAIFAVNPMSAQPDWGFGPGTFIDENGDGFNDLAPDHDGDGIPNSLDEEWVRPLDGTGAGNGAGSGTGECDETGNENPGPHGPGNGGGNNGGGSGDCTGDGSGECELPSQTTIRSFGKFRFAR